MLKMPEYSLPCHKAWHTVVFRPRCCLYRKRLFDVSVEQAAFYQALAAHPQNELTVFVVGDLAQLVDADAGVGGGFLQRQVAFLPNRDLFHGLLSS